MGYQQQELIASFDVENKPQISLANSMTLPGRTLAVIQVNTDLKPKQSGQMYEIEPNYFLTEESPNLYIIPWYIMWTYIRLKMYTWLLLIF